MTPTWRKPVGILSMLLYIILWVFLVASASHWIERLYILLQAVIYMVLGIIWIFPLKSLLFWMEHGHWPKKGKEPNIEVTKD